MKNIKYFMNIKTFKIKSFTNLELQISQLSYYN